MSTRPVSGETDYEELAEFHDLFMVEPWERLRPAVAAAFADLPAEAVIVEFGAGTGMGVRVIGQESPARITALEPSLMMRTVLTARVADDADLAGRVTIVAGSVPGGLALLPGRFRGFVCANMLGHLDRKQRAELFAWVEAHLEPGGVGLVTVQGERTPGEVVQSRSIGDYEYRATFREPTGADEFVSEYEVRQDGELIRSVRFGGRWRHVTAADVAGELRGTGLSVEPTEYGAVLVRRT